MNGQSILRVREILRRLSISRSTFYHMVQAGEFPRPISIGHRSVGWPNTDVDEWIAARIKASRPDQHGVSA